VKSPNFDDVQTSLRALTCNLPSLYFSGSETWRMRRRPPIRVAAKTDLNVLMSRLVR
jgi:hypothetical protein